MKKLIYFLMPAVALVSCSKSEEYIATGIFEADEVVVSSEMGGAINAFDIAEGDTLRQGDLIAVIDSVQVYLQKLQLERQRASVGYSRPDIPKQVSAIREQIATQEREQQRLKNLFADGAATQKQLDDIEAQIKVLNSQLSALLSTLDNNTASINENASALDLQIAQLADKLKKCRIISPIDGTVLCKYAYSGELATPGRAMLKIADLNKVYLRAYFTNEDLADVHLGQKVKIVADYGADKQREYQGVITWISQESEFTPKSIQTRDSRANLVYAVKIAVENDGNLKLGQYGEVVSLE